jgi:hypothetical protein
MAQSGKCRATKEDKTVGIIQNEQIQNDQVEKLVLEGLKPFTRSVTMTEKAMPMVRIYQQKLDESTFFLKIVLIHEDFEVGHFDGEASYSSYPVSNPQQSALNFVRPLINTIKEFTGASEVDFHYSGDRPWKNRPMGSHWADLSRDIAASHHDDDDDDDNRAGWPSKTDNPSGGGRDNNPSKK